MKLSHSTLDKMPRQLLLANVKNKSSVSISSLNSRTSSQLQTKHPINSGGRGQNLEKPSSAGLQRTVARRGQQCLVWPGTPSRPYLFTRQRLLCP